MKKFKLIRQDAFKTLTLGKVYNIIDRGNHYAITNDDGNIDMWVLNSWQLSAMFEEVK